MQMSLTHGNPGTATLHHTRANHRSHPSPTLRIEREIYKAFQKGCTMTMIEGCLLSV